LPLGNFENVSLAALWSVISSYFVLNPYRWQFEKLGLMTRHYFRWQNHSGILLLAGKSVTENAVFACKKRQRLIIITA
jgi:hypothetical protein